jgi:hypothetical protein
VIEEEASELETPASELESQYKKKKDNHRKQTSIMSSKRPSEGLAP